MSQIAPIVVDSSGGTAKLNNDEPPSSQPPSCSIARTQHKPPAIPSERRFTNYVKESAILQLFGASIIKLFRKCPMPNSNNMIAELVSAMGYRLPTRNDIIEMRKTKKNLLEKEKRLIEEKKQLLRDLDAYESSRATYELLDQDEILPPRPENASVNIEQLREMFKNLEFPAEGDDAKGIESKFTLMKLPAITTSDIPLIDRCGEEKEYEGENDHEEEEGENDHEEEEEKKYNEQEGEENDYEEEEEETENEEE